MAEFALVAPVLILLLFGLTFASFYAFRAAASDWGVFITGVSAGSFGGSAAERARRSIVWQDIAAGFSTGPLAPHQRSVRSQIAVRNSGIWLFDVRPVELHQAATYFRWWQFYPGRPAGDIR